MSIQFKMAWRNVWRNKRRSILTIAAITFVCVLLIFMLSFQFGTYEAMIKAAVKVNTGYFQVQAEGYNDDRDMRRVVEHPEVVAEALEKRPEVVAYTFRAQSFSLVSSEDRTYGAWVTGIQPGREVKVSSLRNLVRKGEFIEDGDGEQALVGELLAKNLNIGVGDGLTVLGQGRDGSIAATVVTVKGIIRTGQDAIDRIAVYIPLDTFQDVYFMRGAVHAVVVVTRSLWEVTDTMAALTADLPDKADLAVLDWKDLLPGLAQSIVMDLVGGIIFYLLLLVVVSFSILNTFLMVIFERTREFGLLMAMGTTPGRITRLLLAESGILTLIGIVCGIVLGCLVTWYFQIHGIDFGEASELFRQFGIPSRMYPRLSPVSAAAGPLLVLIITFFVALYPALKVRRLKPVEALTYT